jgi:hypothetical protein
MVNLTALFVRLKSEHRFDNLRPPAPHPPSMQSQNKVTSTGVVYESPTFEVVGEWRRSPLDPSN